MLLYDFKNLLFNHVALLKLGKKYVMTIPYKCHLRNYKCELYWCTVNVWGFGTQLFLSEQTFYTLKGGPAA